MRLIELCEPLFQYVCRLNRSGRKGAGLSPAAVRADVKQILADMRGTSSQDAGLAKNYEAVELALIYFVDAMIEESGLPFAKEWAQQRLQTELKGKHSGDDDFFDLLDETLKDQSEAATEQLTVYYTCIGLGFTGFYTGNPEYLRRKMQEIQARIRHTMDSDAASRIVPSAYENVDQSDLIRPPGRSIVGFVIALVTVAIVVLVGNAYLYYSSTQTLSDSIDRIVETAEDSGESGGEGGGSGTDPEPDEG